MKGRAYRRYMEEVKVRKRLKRFRRWYNFLDANDIKIKNPIWIDKIGTDLHFDSKSFTTDNYRSRTKTKWGLKGKRRKKHKYYDMSNHWTRHKDKVRFYKDLENEGFRHLPTYTQYESELEGEAQYDILSNNS